MRQQDRLVLLLGQTGVLKKKALDHSYAPKAVHQQELTVTPLILGGLLSGWMAMEIPWGFIKDNTTPMLAIIMEAIKIVNLDQIVWG